MPQRISPSASAPSGGVNRARLYQLALFPLNNGATNVYFTLVLSYVLNFGSEVLGMLPVFVSTMITVMRVLDAVTDPILGALIDRTQTRFGKFRPYMALGNGIMAVSILLLYLVTPRVASTPLRYGLFVALYALWVIGYTFQTACTRSAQTVLTNDPRQRPLFTLFNTVGSLIGMGVMQFAAPLIGQRSGGYNTPAFFSALTPLGIALSAALTLLSIIGIAGKDKPAFYGVGQQREPLRLREYAAIIAGNQPLRRLMLTGAGCKLALSVASHTVVLSMLYGSMMGNYDALYLQMMLLGYIVSAPFFFLSIRTAQRHGQKTALQRFMALSLGAYTGVLALLLMWQPGNPATRLSLLRDGRWSPNLFTLAYLVFFGVGYGACFASADMPIPMVADCSDYETCRSGRYVPGVIGTLFSLVDKLVSSLASLVITLALACIGFQGTPDQYTPYAPGMQGVVIALFCVLPMLAWGVSLLAMRGYSLTGQRMAEIQAINRARSAYMAKGHTLKEAMACIRTPEDAP